MDGKDKTIQPVETDKSQDSGDKLDKNPVDMKQVMSDRVALSKSDETQTKVKKFTLGDGAFGIDGVKDSVSSALAARKLEQGDSGCPTGDPPGQIKRDEEGYVTEETYSNGTTVKFNYDENHGLNKVEYSDGTKFEKKGDGWNWQTAGNDLGEVKDEITVTKDGDLVRKFDGGDVKTVHPDGSDEFKSTDGYVVTHDADDKVTSITFPDGSTNRFSYDEKSQLQTISASDGSEWRKNAAGWDCYDESGKQVDHMKSFKVSWYGDVMATAPDGTVYKHNCDGNRVEAKPGVNSRDSHGHVTEATTADGRTQKYFYNETGELAKLELQNGNSYQPDENGTWGLVGPADKPMPIGTSAAVDKDGNVTFRWDDGSKTVVFAAGGEEYTGADKSGHRFARDGAYSEIKYPDGKSTKFEYNEQRKLNKVAGPDGHEFRREGKKWVMYKDGKATDEFDGDIGVGFDNNIRGTNRDGSTKFNIDKNGVGWPTRLRQHHF